jgi:hypothetical protein
MRLLKKRTAGATWIDRVPSRGFHDDSHRDQTVSLVHIRPREIVKIRDRVALLVQHAATLDFVTSRRGLERDDVLLRVRES